MKKLYTILAGICFLFIDFPISTGISNELVHIKGETIKSSFSVEALQYLLGNNYAIDIFSDIVGYILLIIGFMAIMKLHKQFTRALYASVVGLTVSIMLVIIPLITLEPVVMLKTYAICKVVEFFIYIYVTFALARGLYGLVDGFMHLELWKELKSYWDLMAITPVIIYLFGLATIVGFPAAGFIAMFTYGTWLYYNVMFVIKAREHSIKAGIFQ